MKKHFMKKLVSLLTTIIVLGGLWYFRGPILKWALHTFPFRSTTESITDIIKVTLEEKNSLIVYEVNIEGNETATQRAWLIDEVQRVAFPYKFTMSYTVDLDHPDVAADGQKITVRLPEPEPGYQKLIVDEDQMKKVDWLYPLTPQRYAEIKQNVEDRLFEDCKANPEYQAAAWENAKKNVSQLLEPILNQNLLGYLYEIEILLKEAPPAEATPVP